MQLQAIMGIWLTEQYKIITICGGDGASESDEIPVELFQILKDDAVETLHSVCQQI